MNQGVLCSSRPYRLLSALLVMGLGAAAYTIFSILTTSRYIGLPLAPIQSQMLKLSFSMDNLAVLLFFAVSILGTVVLAYANRYLLSDATRTRFMVQLCLTIISVLFFIFSNNLFAAFIGWQWIGLNLYLLLNHYHYQSSANRAAKKKFIINRLGDMCFLLAIVLCYQFYGTTGYSELANMPSVVLPFLGSNLNGHTLILMLVFISIMTKSAQFPFHIWLPDTMQTPTPVSALMHAGVINAGGILLARLSPMFNQTLWLPYMMLSVGVTSLVIGGLLKSVQTDIKKKLAYSTMSQMGYMLMQSAIGCFAAAIFHLVAHGFYKAALFLNAGNALFENQVLCKKPKDITISTLLVSHSIVLLMLISTQLLLPQTAIGILIWTFIAISLEQLVRSALLQTGSAQLKVAVLMMFQLMVIIYFWLLSIFELQLMLPSVALINDSIQNIIAFIIISVHSLMLFIPQHRFQKTPFARKCYGLLLNKLLVEESFRKYLLKPLRVLGDWLNKSLLEKQLHRNAMLAICFLMPLIIILAKKWVIEFAQGSINLLMGLATLMILMMANRAKSLSNILQCLFASHFIILSISILNDNLRWNANQLVILLAYCSLFFSLQWLSTHCEKLSLTTQKVIEDNRLTIWGSYLAVLLFLTIGIPGTASFVVWFQLVASLTINPIALLTLLIANVMLAIVVLHTLQDYVFNLQNTFELTAANKKWQIHSVFIPIIIFNISCGLFPQIIKVLP